MTLAFNWLCWRRDVSNFAMLKYRDFDGYLVTMQHAGTHWLKFMMSVALAEQYGLEPPKYIHNASSNDFIGHPKHQPKYDSTPRLASSHSIPHALFDSRVLRGVLDFPTNVVLLRDLRAALVSNYEKWKDKYACEFSEYLRGDLRGKRFSFDIWGGIHFYNRWSRIRERFPESVYATTYERVNADPGAELTAIFQHLAIDIAAKHIDTAVGSASKDQMAKMLDPDEPVKNIVRQNETDPRSWFNENDQQFFDRAVAEHLKQDFDYRFEW